MDVVPLTPEMTLDLRTTPCPLNFVKTRLALEKIPLHAIIEVWIAADSESVMNIPSSLRAEGHAVVREYMLGDNHKVLWVQRLK